MKTLIKLLMFLWFLIQYSYSYTPYNPTECSLSRYQGQSKCVKLVYNEVNERLERAYKNIIENIPRVERIEIMQEYTSAAKEKDKICSGNETALDCRIAKINLHRNFNYYYGDALEKIYEHNTSTFVKQYNSWLKSKNDYCKRYSNNEIKLKSCHIDYSIPKLKELWDIESILLEYPFEGKWASCGYSGGNFTCETYFMVEQGDNMCSSDLQVIDTIGGYLSIWLAKRYANHVYPVKYCDEGVNGYIGCRILEEGYDKQGRMTYKSSVPFSQWEDDDRDSRRWVQSYYRDGRYLSTHIKTPFLPWEREELMQTNKWLQDCLNYKREGE